MAPILTPEAIAAIPDPSAQEYDQRICSEVEGQDNEEEDELADQSITWNLPGRY